MSYQINWIENDVVIIFEEEVTFHEISKVDDIIYGDPRFGKMIYQLWDFTNVHKHNITIVEASVIGELDKSTSVWNDEVKVALVSTNVEFRELIPEYMKIIDDTNWSVKVFSNVSDARKWCKNPTLSI